MAVTLIAHTEVGAGGAANIDFTSIPSTYDDLLVFCSLRMNQAGYNFSNSDIRFNNDTSSLYSETYLQNSGGTVSSARQTNQNRWFGIENGPASTTSTFSSGYLYIPNYKNSSYNKVGIFNGTAENNSTTTYYMFFSAQLYRSTSAISSLKIAASISSFVQYSSATLYGITKA